MEGLKGYCLVITDGSSRTRVHSLQSRLQDNTLLSEQSEQSEGGCSKEKSGHLHAWLHRR